MKLPFGMMTKLANTDLQKAGAKMGAKKKKKGLFGGSAKGNAERKKARQANRAARQEARGGERSNFSKFIHNMGVAYRGDEDAKYEKFNRKGGDKAAAEKGTANEIKTKMTPKADPIQQAKTAGSGFNTTMPTIDRVGINTNAMDAWKKNKGFGGMRDWMKL